MHEFSLAQSVQETVISIARKQAAREIKKVILKFGAFALIEEDQFRFCFEILQKESELLEETELEIIWISETILLKSLLKGMYNKAAPQFCCFDTASKKH